MSPQLEIARVALGVAEGKASVHKDSSWMCCQKSTWITLGLGLGLGLGFWCVSGVGLGMGLGLGLEGTGWKSW